MANYRVEASIGVRVTKVVKAPSKKAAQAWADQYDWNLSEAEEDGDWTIELSASDSDDVEVRVDRDGEEMGD